ncbi:kinase-like protein [Xylaria arbuscula]|nr:kinase-like protein [Xylaria arbuscula]
MSHKTDTNTQARVSVVEASLPDTQPEFDIGPLKDEKANGGESDSIQYHTIWDDGVEHPSMYNKGGHHPVNLGDVLNGRYEVVHKLGIGGFSLVWLCHDTKTNKWRAIKILDSWRSSNSKEEKIYQHLRQVSSPEELEDSHLAMPLEEFWIDGPNGRHYCVVLPFLGPTAEHWRDDFIKLETALNNRTQYTNKTRNGIHQACADVVRAVHHLHKHGVCHGDIKPKNVLMKLEGVDLLSKAEMVKLLGEPYTYEVETRSGKPPAPHAPDNIIVPLHPLDEFWKEFITSSAVLTDFGESYMVSEPTDFTVLTRAQAPPEALWGGTFQAGPHSDIWSLAVTLNQLVTNQIMFDSSQEWLHVHDMELFLGGLPRPFRTVYIEQCNAMARRPPLDPVILKEQMAEAIDEEKWERLPVQSGYEKLIKEREQLSKHIGYADPFESGVGNPDVYWAPENYEQLMRGGRTKMVGILLPREDVVGVADLLRKMVRYDPTKRITIAEVAHHAWIKNLPRLSSRAPLRVDEEGYEE